MDKKIINQKILTGERALFNKANLYIINTIFEDGESPLKECHDIDVKNSVFKWKYPIWYSKNVNVNDSIWSKDARAGVWYTNSIYVKNSLIEAPKNFRRCDGVTLENVNLSNASETLWSCKNIELKKVNVRGDYFAMNCENLDIDNLYLVGGYSFDGVKNMIIRNSKILTKDAFWNSENVTVYDSFISSEYLGWNAKNLTLINCTIESLQGLCYIDNLVLSGCKLIKTDLAFEYSTVDVDVIGKIDSVKNPISGIIRADEYGEIILETDKIDPSKTKIISRLDNEDFKNIINF